MEPPERKDAVFTSSFEPDTPNSQLSAMDAAALGTSRSCNDAEDMKRLGKKQLYTRNFRLFATIGFATIFTSTWEFVLVSTYSGLIDGGFGGLFAQYIWTFFGSLTVCMSLAEMASMAPTAGGQYHWTSEFAPPGMQKFLSYVAGWTSVLAWQPALAGGLYPAMSAIEALASYQNASFTFTAWQGSLIMIALGFLTVPFNTCWRKALPMFETIVLVLHFAGFLAIIIPLWVMTPVKNPASEVFGSVINSGGWTNTGLAMLVGQVSTFYTLAGSDSAVHLSEEVEDAALTVPRSIVYSYLANSGMGFVMLITMMFCMGPLDAAIDTGVPFISAFTQIGTAGATGLTLILFILLIAGNNTCTTTESRQMWAFARDRGLPYSSWLSKIDKKWNVPLNCIIVSIAINIVLCLINLGSNFAFNIIIGLSSTGSLATYFVSIGCLISARLRKDTPLPKARWSLGRWGMAINIAAVLWSSQVFIFCFFPVTYPITSSSLEDMNWVVVIFFAVVLLSAGFYVLHGRKNYQGPVAFIEGVRNGEVLQSVGEEEVVVFRGRQREKK